MKEQIIHTVILAEGKEKKIESFLRKNTWILYSMTILTALSLYYAIYICSLTFNDHPYISLFLSGLFAHSFFVITMHDGAHKSITRTKFDYLIMNFCSGLILLPFYTELFKKYHLMHHAHTNTNIDPLWSNNKKRLFDERRKLYALLQCLPFAFNVAILFGYKKRIEQTTVKTPSVNIPYMLLSLAVALTVYYFVQPSIWFILGTFTVMTSLGAIRYWGEHMGTKQGKESNTHWFPLGMGIGNHEVHHHYPGYSWLTLTIGLLSRKMDTNPIKSIYGILFVKSFHHYKPKK